MTERATVVLTDNDRAIRELMARFLEAEGYTVLQAASGNDALALIVQHPGPVALLITDVMMAGLDGFSLAALATEQRPEMAVLYMSGHFDRSFAVRAGVREAAQPFLAKPFRREELVAKIDEVLRLERKPEAHVIAVVVGSLAILAQPLPERRPTGGVWRAMRWRVRLPMRYRRPGEFDWYAGTTENMSRSGVLFRLKEGLVGLATGAAAGVRTPLELALELPRGEQLAAARAIHCDGSVVRVVPAERAGVQPAVAVAVDQYRLAHG